MRRAAVAAVAVLVALLPHGCAPAPHLRFQVGNDDTVTDVATGLVWQRQVSGKTQTLVAAFAACASRPSPSKGEVWELPDAHELLSIVDFTVYDPAVDTDAFPGTPTVASGKTGQGAHPATVFWTAQQTPLGTIYAVDFYDGSTTFLHTSGSRASVRCVRHARSKPLCMRPLVACAGACVDFLSDWSHCGGCFQPCGDGKACIEGVCCHEGQAVCDEGCADLQTDPSNCGTCGHSCDGDTCCAGTCANLMQDNENCGTCGRVCVQPLPVCAGGGCAAP